MTTKIPSKRIIQHHSLWATPIYLTKIDEFNSQSQKINFNDDILSYAKGLKEKGKGVIKSNRGGWQSDLLDNEDDITLPLKNTIDEVCKSLNLNIKKTTIKQMWININQENDFNIIHQHGHYHISGTYYVKTSKNCGRIVFKDHRTSAVSNQLFNVKYSNFEFFYLQPEEGLLSLWPSFLEHFVEPNRSKEERISISFDVICNYDI